MADPELLRLLLGDLRNLVERPWVDAALIGVSVLAGAIVGIEREGKDKPAGIKTVALISLGSTVFTMLSREGAGADDDGTRIAAQIVTGVGFLGAGAILRDRGTVIGLTTAATIWVVAAIGMAIGFGYAVAGLALSILVPSSLTLMSKLAKKMETAFCRLGYAEIVYPPLRGKARFRLAQMVADFGPPALVVNESVDEAGNRHMIVRYCARHRHHLSVLSELAKLEAVDEIHELGARYDGPSAGFSATWPARRE